MIVVDTSVLLTALVDEGESGERARAHLVSQSLAAPEVMDLEFVSAVRGLLASRKLTRRRAEVAVDDLMALPLRRVAHRLLLRRCWELRDNLTPYDAAYVSLAEELTAPLLTADRRLAAAPGLRCDVLLLT